jgi:sugar lactone lactonase YvrE
MHSSFSALAALVAFSTVAVAQDLIEVGPHRYRWDASWGRPFAAGDFGLDQEGTVELGNTHGCMVVRGDGNILVNTDKDHAVVVFSPDGEVVSTWGKEFHGGLHGMCLRKENGKEVLYLAHTRRHEVVKTTIDGKVLWTIGWPEQSGIYKGPGQYRPTAVAVAPDGRIYVGDGYGKSWVHCYDKDRNYLKSFGGPGTEAGKMRTPHGLWMDTRGDEPLLLVCDRENHRLQWFTLDGAFVRKMDQDLRRPCNVWPMPDGGLVVADLVGRITFLDRSDKVYAHVGDNPDPKLRAKNGIPRARWKDGEFLSPHSVCVDADGHVYVMDWNSLGRISRLTHQPARPAARDGQDGRRKQR